jgi:Ras-related protein Rab-8A
MSKRELYYKILILGDSSVGKTCFLTRYADDIFEVNHISTTGMDYKLKNITLENNKIVKLQIWDTLGQDRYRSITRNYYKGAHGIILIYDITERKSFDSVSNWVKTIREEADVKVVIVLAANKCDFEQKRQVSKEEGEKLAQELNLTFFECSAKDNKNINETFDDLVSKLVINFPKVGGAGEKLKQKKAGGEKNSCC